MRLSIKNLPHILLIALFAWVIFGPLLNMLIWAFTESWFFPAKLPTVWGFKYWERVFRPQAGAIDSLVTSVHIAAWTVVVSLLVAIPAGYALARRSLPVRTLIMLTFLIPQAFPSVAVFINIGRIFYDIGLNGTIFGVVMVHSVQGLVYAVWISTAAFSAVDRDLELAARDLGSSPLQSFRTVSLPIAAPGIMASAIFVFLNSLDEFTGTFFVGVPDITTLPLMMYTASMEGNYQIASITALFLLIPSVGFMLVVERFLKSNVVSKIGV
ncbi:ABC transporter permease [Kiloniella laminariae]|uniref:ABC transporter permease n=1 Tax=Kiloniella laminariae TaxID=454162 RepID=UPI00037C46F9|nr:ABC transporter permease subunit [Kiloniella laminariae]